MFPRLCSRICRAAAFGGSGTQNSIRRLQLACNSHFSETLVQAVSVGSISGNGSQEQESDAGEKEEATTALRC